MFSQEALQELLDFESEQGVVSVYLGADLSQPTRDETMKLTARSMMKELDERSADSVAVIDQYLVKEHAWIKPGLALFCCASRDFFRAYPVETAFRNRVRLSRKPYVKPLAHLLDFYANYGVVIVDRVGARYYNYHLGELLATDGIMGEDVRKLKKGRGSSATGMRGGIGGAGREEEAAQRNLRQAAEETKRFFELRDIRRLFLGGTSETVSQFREMLPKRLQSCIAGTFAAGMDISETEVREQTLLMLRKANQEREETLIESMITAAAKGGNAVTGLQETLKAIGEGRVQTLVMAEGLRAPGFRNPTNGLIVSANGEDYVQQGWIPVQDVIESAVEKTMSYGGHVEIITGSDRLERAGQIGALLRY